MSDVIVAVERRSLWRKARIGKCKWSQAGMRFLLLTNILHLSITLMRSISTFDSRSRSNFMVIFSRGRQSFCRSSRFLASRLERTHLKSVARSILRGTEIMEGIRSFPVLEQRPLLLRLLVTPQARILRIPPLTMSRFISRTHF